MDDSPGNARILPADNPAVIAHVNLLENVISRLANNSASCKTWCLALVAALLGLVGATHAPAIIIFAIVAVVIFWLLDSGYLAQERAYRDLYTRMVHNIQTNCYTLSYVYEARVPVDLHFLLRAIASWSTFPVYIGLLLILLIVVITGWSAIAITAK